MCDLNIMQSKIRLCFCCFPGSLLTCTLCICRATGQRRLLGLGEKRRESVVLKCSNRREELLLCTRTMGWWSAVMGKAYCKSSNWSTKLWRTNTPSTMFVYAGQALDLARRHQPRMEEPPVMDLHLAVRKMDNKQYLLLSKYNLQQ